jgi:hypothetical protein
MAEPYEPNERVRVHTAAGVVTGVIWSCGPTRTSYWVVPDQPQPNMTQGCIQADTAQLETPNAETLW